MIAFLDSIGNFWDRQSVLMRSQIVLALVLNCAWAAWEIVDFFR